MDTIVSIPKQRWQQNGTGSKCQDEEAAAKELISHAHACRLAESICSCPVKAQCLELICPVCCQHACTLGDPLHAAPACIIV